MAAMFPVALDLARLPVAVIGNTAPAATRVRQLREAGAAHLAVYADDPCPALADAAEGVLAGYLPSSDELAEIRVLYLVDLAAEPAAYYRETARRLGALLNHEDVLPDCEFHSVSQVRRGDLVLAISTAGKSPGLAVRLRRYLARLFGPAWDQHLEELGRRRLAWRDTGADTRTVKAHTDAELARRGLLAEDPRAPRD